MKTLLSDNAVAEAVREFRKRVGAVAIAEAKLEWGFPNGERVTFPTYTLNSLYGQIQVGLPTSWKTRIPHLIRFVKDHGPPSPDVEINIPLEFDRSVAAKKGSGSFFLRSPTRRARLGRVNGGVMKWMRCSMPVALLTFATPTMAETAAEVFKHASPSVVVVVTYGDAGKPTELGSGIVLSGDSVATNCHVLKGGAQYRVHYQEKDYPAQLRKSDWDRDICSLTVSGLNAPPVVLGDTTKLEVGAQVYAIGAPEGLQLTLSEGIVSSLRNVDGGSYIQTTAAISPGSSGGGLFDDRGRLLGLTSFFMSEGQQLNFALPVEWIEALPQRSTQRTAQGASEVDWLNQAAALETNKDWSGLITLAERWTKVTPDSGIAWFALGEAYNGAGEYGQAVGPYRQALQIDPQNGDAWNNLGVAYAKTGQYAQAIEAYQLALKINSKDVEVWNNLALAYDQIGQHAQVIDALREVLQIDPQAAKSWDNLGIAYGKAGEWTQAINAERQAVRIDPKLALAWFTLGVAYNLTGQNAQAIAAYQKLETLSPGLAKQLFDIISESEGLTVKGMTLGARWDALDKPDARTARCEQVKGRLKRCDFLDTYWGHETTFHVFYDKKGIITLITVEVPEGIGHKAEFEQVVHQYGQPSKQLPGVYFWDVKEATVVLIMKTDAQRDLLNFQWKDPNGNAQIANPTDF